MPLTIASGFSRKVEWALTPSGRIPDNPEWSTKLRPQADKVKTLDLDRTLPRYGQFTCHSMTVTRLSSLERDVMVVGFIDPDELNWPITVPKRHQ